ncbi:hypothetical protein [Alkalihalobacillus trypoxylicola]|uniref:Uncharacterized protein n=1 Tax=Alkalihalobacillus trypoxylicola TaxID=519424 RepID=A0A162EDT4_9BACI|nr:hypothetical protein [Alkalihalobacillus trypoxylicola]KYG32345.1 hypothetical protein AZF04_06170 [Alkalihalobacillus trypoxylicola]
MLTEREWEIIHQYILLITVRRALEKDYNIFEKSSLKYQNLYLDWAKRTLDQISKELYHVKKKMKSSNITVDIPKKDGLFSQYQYTYRGYSGTNKVLNIHLRNQSFDYVQKFLR